MSVAELTGTTLAGELPAGTFQFDTPMTIPGSFRGAGRGLTVLDYRGAGDALTWGGGDLLQRADLAGFTLDLRNSTADRGLVVDNITKSRASDLFLNGTGRTLVGLYVAGAPDKSTFFNSFDNLDVVANDACVELTALANRQRFRAGVWEGSGSSLRATTAAGTCGTNNFTDVAMQSDGPFIVDLNTSGTGGQVSDFRFFNCNFEPGQDTTIYAGSPTLTSRNVFLACTKNGHITLDLDEGNGNVWVPLSPLPIVSGSRGGNAALADLLADLAAQGLVIDTTTA